MRSEPLDGTMRFVLFDDDPTYRAIIIRVASMEKMKIDVYESLEELGSIGLLGRYDAAIVDYDLGGFNGVEIAQYLSSLFGDIPMVLVSQHARSPDQDGWPASIKMFVKKSRGYSYILSQAKRLAELEPRRNMLAGQK